MRLTTRAFGLLALALALSAGPARAGLTFEDIIYPKGDEHDAPKQRAAAPAGKPNGELVRLRIPRRLWTDDLADAVTVHEADTFADAIGRAYAMAQPSGVVLLAPACASFDMFRDYAERGRKFKEEVARIVRER